jgi:acetyl-CoA carboxylase alpha subunit
MAANTLYLLLLLLLATISPGMAANILYHRCHRSRRTLEELPILIVKLLDPEYGQECISNLL